MPRRILVVFSASLILAACSDGVPTSPGVIDGPSFALSDGSTGGTEGFFFLPPIVDQPDDATGEFNENLPPRVEICKLGGVGDETTECDGKWFRKFSTSEISVDLGGELYSVGWQTGADDLDFMSIYRIQVFIGAQRLGFRDVDPVETAQEVPRTPSPDIYIFKNGSNIPIKFRIESDVLCDPTPEVVVECIVASATTAEGGTIALEGGGVELFTNSISTPEGVVAVIVERLNPNIDCLTSLDIPQFGDCFRIRTEPELTEPMDPPALVALCFDPNLNNPNLSHDQFDLLQVHRFNEETANPVVEALPNALTEVCGETRDSEMSSLSSSSIMRLAGATWRAVRGVLGLPQPLLAANFGLGGLTSSFSRFRWALPSRFDLLEGNGQTALVETDVAVRPAVRVVDFNGDPVQNATVHFKVAQGDGTVVPSEPIAVSTDGHGMARVTRWTMGAVAGPNKLDAFGFGISAGPTPFSDANNLDIVPLGTGMVTFEATACAPGFGSPDANGFMEPGEWDCAIQQDFPVNLSGGGSTTGTLFWMNDVDNLYLAVRLLRSSEDKVNSLRFDFDNNNDGFVAEFDDAIEFDGARDLFTDEFLTEKCTNRGQSGCGSLDTADEGTSNGRGGFSNDGMFSVYEFSHPLDSGDEHDMSVVAPGVVSFYLTLRTGKGAQGNTQWPGFRSFYDINIVISDGSS